MQEPLSASLMKLQQWKSHLSENELKYNIYVINMNEGKRKDGRKEIILNVYQNVGSVSI